MFSKIIQALQYSPIKNKKTNSQFAVQTAFVHTDLQIHVNRIGEIALPITQNVAEKLIKNSTPAKFGFREKTLLDKTIRNTYEIPASAVKIDIHQENLKRMLAEIQKTMGLSDSVVLTANLHNLLIYEPGQFFKPHQDSEKLDGMIASLVIILPSPHIGGDLVVQHRKNKKRFVSENLNENTLKCFAFYADCQHEVEPVKQGYRIALTYNLVLQPEKKSIQQVHENRSLENALREYFQDKNKSNSSPRKFIYFLDHDYTEHSLQWGMLKRVDYQNALDFKNAAQKLNLISHLALVEHHETWNTNGDDRYDDPEPTDLIDSDTTLSFWVDDQNQKLSYGSLYISEDDACYLKETKSFEPTETEYEGWMGNYGNTIDYWYRRAAVVLWKADDHFAIQFELDFGSAFKKLMQLTKKLGNEKTVLEIVKKTLSLIHCPTHDDKTGRFFSLMDLAKYINDKETAFSLLSEYSVTSITPDCIKKLALLQATYSAAWCLKLLLKWSDAKNYYGYSSRLHIEKFSKLIAEAMSLKLDATIIDFLLQYQFNSIFKDIKKNNHDLPLIIQISNKDCIALAIDFLKSCLLIKKIEQITIKFIEHLILNPNSYILPDLAEIYFAIKITLQKTYPTAYAFFANYLLKEINKELQEGQREANDWSLVINLGCSCDLCKTAKNFLRSKNESKKVWSIVQDARDHVTGVLKKFVLPVAIVVEKKGSPYKLILTKTEQLFQLANKRFELLTKYSKMLNKNKTGVV